MAAKQQDALPVFESMPQVSAITGMPVSLMRAAKKAGCPAFITGNRIRLELLLKWYFSQDGSSQSELPEGLGTWREALNKVQTEREQLKLSNERGETMLTVDAQTQAASAMTEAFSELERMARELPPAMAGLDAVAIYKRMSAEIERIRKTLKKKFEEVGK